MSSSFLPATTESIAQALEAKDPFEAMSILYRILVRNVHKLRLSFTESKLHFSLTNLPKAKAALTAANAIHVPPAQQEDVSDDFGQEVCRDIGSRCWMPCHDDPKTDAIYPATLETISNVGKVVDSLFGRSAKIMA
ncbi:hypothetical protein P8452_06454 [Trifolium repens]|nr:hypothetical protein P8452_06454 [Trifolium repens]